MFKNKKFILFALLMVLICCVSTVSAADDLSVDALSDAGIADSSDDSLSVENDEQFGSVDDSSDESIADYEKEQVADDDVLAAEEKDNSVSGQNLLDASQKEILSDITREVSDDESFEEAFSKMTKQGYSDQAQIVNILISSGIYTISIKPDLEWEYDEEYEFGYYSSSGVSKLFALGIFTVEGIGDDVIFRCANGYNLDLKGGLDTTEWGTEAIRDKITHKNIIFDCDVTLGSRSYEFINCTFNKTLSINGYDNNKYWNLNYDTDCDVINNITFTDCNFAFDKEDISINKISDENIQFKDDAFTLSFKNCKFNFTETTPTQDTNSSINGTSDNGTSTNTTGNTTSDNGTSTNTTGNTTSDNGTSTNTTNANSTAPAVSAKVATKLAAAKVSAVYGVAKKLTVTLKDKNGKVLANKKVSVKVGSISKTLTTNKKGQVSLNVAGLVPKTYTATVKFAGDKSYTASAVKPKVVVSKAKVKLAAKAKTFKVKAKTKKYTVSLKNNKGKVMKSTKLTLKIGKKTYTAKTNKKGVATFKVKLTKKGKSTAVVKFAGNKYFKALSKKVKIVVK